jgi:hypothetical protein
MAAMCRKPSKFSPVRSGWRDSARDVAPYATTIGPVTKRVACAAPAPKHWSASPPLFVRGGLFGEVDFLDGRW